MDPEIILSTDLQLPFKYHRRFDLAICLEVAEHLEEHAADIIVETLTSLSNVILFSAGVPGQGGQNHINEQWADYWVQKFSAKGYSFYDNFRMLFWNNPEVDYWYKQNMFFVIKDGENCFGFGKQPEIFSIIHPELFSLLVRNRNSLYEDYIKLRWGSEKSSIYFKLLGKRLLKLTGIIK